MSVEHRKLKSTHLLDSPVFTTYDEGRNPPEFGWHHCTQESVFEQRHKHRAESNTYTTVHVPSEHSFDKHLRSKLFKFMVGFLLVDSNLPPTGRTTIRKPELHVLFRLENWYCFRQRRRAFATTTQHRTPSPPYRAQIKA